MSDYSDYDDTNEIDIDANIDEFDEIDDPSAINFENVKDADSDEDEDIDEEEEDLSDPIGDEVEVLTSDYYHKVINDQKQDYISSVSVANKDCLIVPANNRRTNRFISRKEYARIVGVRTKLIALYAKVFTDVTNIIDPKEMAIKEIKEKKCPLMLKREIGIKDDKKICELWSVNEMIIPFD